MSTKMDPILMQDNVTVEAEELLEPELERPKGTPKRLGALRVRLGEYGNRVLGSGRRLVEVVAETLSNIGTAVVGSILFLPLLIITRALTVLAHDFIAIFKPLLLSLLRAVIDVFRGILWPLHAAFTGFNKRLLYPLIKRIREDDAAALAAFVVLLALTIGLFYLLSNLL